ncbi:MAG: hypothetical protein R3E31_12065 [Chloroflexota bacterium]|nr:hypothetical protein [Ardenticatenaceae bacterium]
MEMLLNQLSSQTGNSRANYEVAAQCLQDKTLLAGIIEGTVNRDNDIVIDCAEVLTEIAKVQPVWIAPYGHLLPGLLNNKNNRARWEAMHCFALIAEYIPEIIEPMLDKLMEIVEKDKSVIVRDYAVDTVGNYSKTSETAAEKAYPILERSAQVWEGRHAKQALEGLGNVAAILPGKKREVQRIAEENLEHKKGVVRKIAKKLAHG